VHDSYLLNVLSLERPPDAGKGETFYVVDLSPAQEIHPILLTVPPEVVYDNNL